MLFVNAQILVITSADAIQAALSIVYPEVRGWDPLSISSHLCCSG
jgi:hypothetical protein